MTTLDDEIRALRDRVVELEMSEADRERAEKVQNALYRIAETASVAEDMQDFYARIHGIVRELMYADNFYIALYDGERDMINFPYNIDEDPDQPDPNLWEPLGSGYAAGTTAYLLRTGRPMLLTAKDWRLLAARGEIVLVGEEAVSWLGVPLQSEGSTLGAVVVQSYRDDLRHTEADKELLTFVGRYIASALERTRLIDETRQRNAELALINDVQRGLAMNLTCSRCTTWWATGSRRSSTPRLSTSESWTSRPAGSTSRTRSRRASGSRTSRWPSSAFESGSSKHGSLSSSTR